ncbi:MAG: hypothetical protein AAB524_00850 [Patescibacteria group bacterium]
MFQNFKPEIKLFLLVVAFIAVVVSVAGILVLQKSISRENPLSVLPVMRLEHQGKTYDGVQGSYCWPVPVSEKAGGAICVDKLFPQSSETITVRQGDELVLSIDAAKPPQTLTASTLAYPDQPPGKTFSLGSELTQSFQIDHPVDTYFLLLFGTWEEGDISYGFKIDVQPQQVSTPVDTSGPAPNSSTPLVINSMEGWQTYSNGEFGFEVNYPANLMIIEPRGYAGIVSPKYTSCEEGTILVQEINITFVPREGKSYKDIWETTFTFPFEEGYYDGSELIGGKKAYYTFLGSGILERKVYLVPQSHNRALQIDVHTRKGLSECESNFLSTDLVVDFIDQILATFRFAPTTN